MPVRIKICGITRIEDAMAASQAGADAIGLVFAPSPRRITIEQARALCAQLPPFLTRVGLFVNATPDDISAVLAEVPLDVLQFHGAETGPQCRCYGRPYIKAIRLAPGQDIGTDIGALTRDTSDAAAWLFDSWHPQQAGGTGEAFDWSRVPKQMSRPIILAGGLTPDNVAAAVRAVRPYAVDVSSGVEESKGIKDSGKIAAFVRAATGDV